MFDEQGILTIYSVENTADKGLKPVEQLVEQATAYYAERQVGVTRMYAAKGANCKIDALVRCFCTELEILEGYVVILTDGNQYQVDAIQKVIGKDACDLTLTRVEKTYDIYAE